MVDQSALNIDEKIASLFQPDTLLATQYFDNLRSKTLWEPEKRLMLAILEDAVQCFQDNVLERSGKRERLFEEAQEWILKENDDWVFSFENICEVLGFSAQYVRQGLLRWKERRLKHHARHTWQEKAMVGSVVAGNSAYRRARKELAMSFSVVPLLLAGQSISPEVREALLENHLQDAATLLMQKHGLSCIEAGHLLDVSAC